MYKHGLFMFTQNPCNDKRHRAIWSTSKNCSRLPDFIVIGPQKSGNSYLRI